MIHLYTAPTPNGRKVSILLEELKIPYTVHRVDLAAKEQKSAAFLKINPNGKIPAIVDELGPEGKSFPVFESGAILVYLAEKVGRFLPHDAGGRSEVLQWVMFQMSAIGPMMGQLGHFLHDAPEKIPYAIQRYTDESKRLLGVLDHRLKSSEYIAHHDYTIADMAHYPWLVGMKARAPGLIDTFPAVNAWMERVGRRDAVQRGMQVP